MDPLSAEALAERLRNNRLADLRADALLRALGASAENGLPSALVAQRQREFGENRLPPPPAPSYAALIWDGLHDATIIMLILAAIVSLILALAFQADDSTAWIEGAAILGTVVVVLNVQAWTDYRTAAAFRQQQLELENSKLVEAVRDGAAVQMHPRQVVVGDVLRVSVGDILACDGIVLTGDDLAAEEAALTGEPKAQAKPAGAVLLSGTSVVSGQGRMLVLAVGPWSVQGRLLQFVQDGTAKPAEPPARATADAAAIAADPAVPADEAAAVVDAFDLPQHVYTFGTAAASDRSGAALTSSLRSARESAVALSGRKQTRCRRFWGSLLSVESGNGGTLMEKLDALAINIGKLGLLIAVVVFVVTSSQWAVMNYVYGDECNVFDSNQTACELQPSWGCYWQGASAMCSKQWAGAHDLERLLQFFITSVTILVVAVPEGLPLAVALSISVSMRRMLRDCNRVKTMQSSETMGSATTICSDKTGTLTENRMAVVRAVLGDARTPTALDAPGAFEALKSEPAAALLAEAAALCSESTSRVRLDAASGTWAYAGNATECALLRLAIELGIDPEAVRRAHKEPASSLDWGVRRVPFSSARKRMSCVVRTAAGFRTFTKGAPALVMDACTHVRTAQGTRILDAPLRRQLGDVVSAWQASALRTLAVAYRDAASLEAAGDADCVLLGVVGIEDPLRPAVAPAIASCRKAGVDVRMCTGDALETAVAIAQQCGILRRRDMEKGADGRLVPRRNFAMTGAEFDERVHAVDASKPRALRRAWDAATGQAGDMLAHPFALDADGNKVLHQHKFDQIWPRLRVLARCLPEDKLTLVKGLQQSRLFERADECDRLLREEDIAVFPDFQVVAVTGDGTNDAPALKQADVGFAMGVVGTDIAKQACDIIILDDNFASIVAAVMWGRNVFDSISKFVQFQLTVNVTAIVVATVGSFVFNRSPLSAVQMLWVNMIMDSLASLALATEPASPELMDRQPYGKKRPIISRIMLFNIVGQAALQLAVVFGILFRASWLPGWDNSFGNTGNGGGQWDTGNVRQFPFDASIFAVEAGQYTQGSGVSTHWTMVFNTFVLMQLFNEFNSRKLQTVRGLQSGWREWNMFAGVTRNPTFLVIVVGTFIIQGIIVQNGSLVFAVVPLTVSQWVFCIGMAALSLPWQWVINAAILVYHRPRGDRFTSGEPTSPKLHGGAGLSRDNSHSSHASAGISGLFREGSGRIKVNVVDMSVLAAPPGSP